MPATIKTGGAKLPLGYKKKFPLQDSKEANLMRDIFPYTTVPKITFDGKVPPTNLPKDIFITDTTFRDGQQARPPYTPQQIVDLFKMMHRLGGPKGIIRQAEFFLYSDKDKDAVRKCLELGYPYPEVTGWIRADKRDLELVKQMELKETGILASCSDYHVFHKLRKTRRQTADAYKEVVRQAIEWGILPRVHLEDMTRADMPGFVIPFVQELMDLSAEAKVPVKIRLCDTMGYGVPWPQSPSPRGVPALCHAMTHDCGVPPENLEWHGHNDFHKVLINASTAWLYGCAAANGTLLGFGERTGNPPIEGLIIEYIGFNGGNLDGIDTTVITELAQYFEGTGYRIPPNYPLVGKDFNVTRAGIHADGLLKFEEIYNIFDTEKLLKRPIAIAITDKSGISGVAEWINTYFKLDGNRKIQKDHPGVQKIKEWIDHQYNVELRTTSISDQELVEQTAKYFPELTKK